MDICNFVFIKGEKQVIHQGGFLGEGGGGGF